MENNNEEIIFIKIIILGDSGVGKTSLLTRYCYSKFDPYITPTIGSDFSPKIIKIGKKTLRLQLWDIAGQDRFKTVSRLYIKGALGCIIVMDSTNEKTLNGALEWKSVVLDCCTHELPIVLLENKFDLLDKNSDVIHKRQEKLDLVAKDNGFVKAFMTSAKENINLEEAFSFLCQEIIKMQKKENPTIEESGNFTLKTSKENKEKKCC